MKFYNNTHPYYCGIDLHARSLYVCIIDQAGETCRAKSLKSQAAQHLSSKVVIKRRSEAFT